MSVYVMSRVWKCSNLDSTELLLLVAIADNANDDNVCWPGIPHLAEKTRKSERQVTRLLQKLEESGELFVSDRKGGRKSPNLYLVSVGLTKPEIVNVLTNQFFKMSSKDANKIADSLLERQKVHHKVTPKKGDIQGQEKGDIQGQKGDIQGQKGDIQGQKGDIAMSPEPSYNRINHHKKRAAAPAEKSKPDSVQVFFEVTERYPPKEAWELITQKVGADPENLAFWHDVIVHWIAAGWRKTNITGMLDHFTRRELPSTRPKTPPAIAALTPARNGTAEVILDEWGNPL